MFNWFHELTRAREIALKGERVQSAARRINRK